MKYLFILMLSVILLSAEAQVQFTNYGSKNSIGSIAEKGNNVWIGTNSGLFVRSKSSGAIILTYTTDNGLPSNYINDVKIDAFGNVWVATSNGLAKFDGNSWQAYGVSAGLPSYNTNVYGITIDQSGSIWVYVRNNDKIYRFENNNTFTPFDLTTNPYCIQAGPNGKIWIGTFYGISSFDPSTENTVDYNNELGTGQLSVNDIVVDANLNIWFVAENGLHKYDGVNFSNYPASQAGTGTPLSGENLSIDDSGNLWMSYGNKLKKYIISSDQASNYQNTSTINSITVDGNGRVWLGTDYGIKRFLDVNTTWDEYIVSNSIANSDVSDFEFDASGNLWVATHHGLSRLQNNIWTTWIITTGGNENNDNYFYGIDIDPSGNIWLGSHSGMSKFDGTNFTNYFSFPRVKHILCNDDGTVWAGRDDGLMLFDNGSNTLYTTADGLAANNCFSLDKDGNGNLWICTSNGGVTKWDGTSFTNYTTADGLQSNYTHSAFADANNNIWCLNNSGVDLFDGSSWTAVDIGATDIPNSFYESIAENTDGNFWLASSEGIVKYDGQHAAVYNIQDGLISNNVTVSKIAPDGTKWFATSSGLSKATCSVPTVGFSDSGTCLPSLTTLTDTSLSVDETSIYQWDINNDGSIDYTTQNISHDFSTEGVYPVKLIVANDECSAEIVKNISIYAPPTVALTPSGITGICSGSHTTIHASTPVPDNLYTTDFNVADIAASGWTPNGEGINNWAINSTNNSGGASPELKLNWNNQFSGEAYIVSPIINTSNYSHLSISLKDSIDWYSNSFTIGIKTTSNGTDWTIVWSKTIDSQLDNENVSFDVNNADVGSATFQIAIFVDCNTSYDFDFCYFDDIQINDYQAQTGGYTYAWSTGSSDSLIQVSDAGTYSLTVTNGTCTYEPTPTTINLIEPINPHICMVSVDQETNKNLIVWEKPTSDSIDYYYIYKEIATNNYQIIGSRNYDEVSEFVDYNSVPEIHADRYKISLVDMCGNESELSPYHQTMNLSQAQGAQNDELVLLWNKYEDESGDFIPSEYKVYRGIDPENMTLDGTVTGSLSNYNYNALSVVDNEKFIVLIDMPTCAPSDYHATGGPYYQSSSNLEDEGIIATSINDITINDLSIYPNPMQNFTQISSDKLIESVKIYNIAGEKMQEATNLNTHEFRVDRKDLPNGTYIIEINGSIHQKLIIK